MFFDIISQRNITAFFMFSPEFFKSGYRKNDRFFYFFFLSHFYDCCMICREIFFLHQILLLKDENDLFLPFLIDIIKKIPGTLAVGVFGFKYKDDEIGDRNKTFCELLMMLYRKRTRLNSSHVAAAAV